MPNWTYICTTLAKEFYRPQLGGEYRREHLIQSWKTVSNEGIIAGHDRDTMSGHLGHVYDFLMTISKMELKDSDKVKRIKLLLKSIAGGFNDKWVDNVFRDGEIDVISLPDVSTAEVLFDNRIFHKDVVQHAKKLFINGHYSPCVNDTCKAYNIKVQQISGSSKDGVDLMQTVFSLQGILKVNQHKTESEKNEQTGFRFISAGIMSCFRNTTSHEIDWITDPHECLEILGMISYLFKKLDKVIIL